MNTETKNFVAPKALTISNLMPHRVYKFRTIGMALAGIPIAVVLAELQAPIYHWIWWLFGCYLWPHIAFITARKSKNPLKTEFNNLIIDSFIVGSWSALIHFNLLPSVLFITITLADKINIGVNKLWLHSLPSIILGIIAIGLITEFAYQPQSTLLVTLTCLPILIIHILSISTGRYQLTRKIKFQNIRYDELSQKDSLTSLLNKSHWQEQVNELIRKSKESESTATIILITIDDFNLINNQYGHSTGDDVLLAISDKILSVLQEGAIAARFDGAEFAIAVPVNITTAESITKTIYDKIQEIKKTMNLSLTLSMGLSEINNTTKDLRAWLDAADKSLYYAKSSGQNQIICTDF